VAERARVTPPSIYRHFADKSDLLRAVVQRRFDDFAAAMRGAEAGAADARDALKRRCHAYVRYASTYPGHYRLLFSATDLGPAPLGVQDGAPHPGAASFEDHAHAVARALAATRQPGQRNAEFLAILLWTQLHGIVDLRISKPEM